jgi:hypothetical protein
LESRQASKQKILLADKLSCRQESKLTASQAEKLVGRHDTVEKLTSIEGNTLYGPGRQARRWII